MKPVIGIIGGGNMGNCLMGGLIQHGYPIDKLKIADHSSKTCSQLQKKWGIFSTTDNVLLASSVDILVLAVKPQQMKEVIQSISSRLNPEKILLISIAAGITTKQIQNWSAVSLPIIRAMPNTPALLGYGITGLYAANSVSQAQSLHAESLFNCVGKTLWISDEPLMDVVTALSGSGPAYFFYVIEGFINSAQKLGLTPEQARKLTLETAIGSTYMALNHHENLQMLRQKVTSPGGTTEEGIRVLKDGKLPDLIFKALKAATQKGQELSQQFD